MRRTQGLSRFLGGLGRGLSLIQLYLSSNRPIMDVQYKFCVNEAMSSNN